ncbi:hypothetical protein ACHAW6_011837 [Cyclotella cf. meneghiniana]
MKRKRWGVIDPSSTTARSTPPLPTTGPMPQPACIQAAAEAALNAVLPKFGPHNLPPPPPKRPRIDGGIKASAPHPQFVNEAASKPLYHGSTTTQRLPQTSPAKGTTKMQPLSLQHQSAHGTNFDSKEAALKVLQRRKRLEAWKKMMKGVDNGRDSGDDGELNNGTLEEMHKERGTTIADSDRKDAATDATVGMDKSEKNHCGENSGDSESSITSQLQQVVTEHNQSKQSPKAMQNSTRALLLLPSSERACTPKLNVISSSTSSPIKQVEGPSRSNDTNHETMNSSTQIKSGREFMNLPYSEDNYYSDQERFVQKTPAAAISNMSEDNAILKNEDSVKEKQTATETKVNSEREGRNIKEYASSLMDKLRVLEQKVAAAASSPGENGNPESVLEATSGKTHTNETKQSEEIEQNVDAESPVKEGVPRVGKEPNKKTRLKATKQTGTNTNTTSEKKKKSLFRRRLAIPMATATTTDKTAKAAASTGKIQTNSSAPSNFSSSQMEEPIKPTTPKNSHKTTKNRKKSKKKDAASAPKLLASLWDYDYNPSESSDSEIDLGFLFRVDVDIVGEGEMIWSKALPRRGQNDDDAQKGDDILCSRISSVQDQIRKADALIQSNAPSYLEYRSKGWMDSGSIPTTATDEKRKLVPVPPSEKPHASSGAAQEFLSLLKSTALLAYNNSNPLANDKVMEFLTIVKESRNNNANNSSIKNPYQLMKRIWKFIQSMTHTIDQNEDNELLANELARKFDAFLPQGYSMLSQNYLWNKSGGIDEEKKDVMFVESCARTYLAFSTMENPGDIGGL